MYVSIHILIGLAKVCISCMRGERVYSYHAGLDAICFPSGVCMQTSLTVKDENVVIPGDLEELQHRDCSQARTAK